MIIKMKKSAVICLLAEKEQALAALRDLGVLHVEVAELADTEDRTILENNFTEARHALHILDTLKSDNEQDSCSEKFSGRDLCRTIIKYENMRLVERKKLETLEKIKLQLLPWGNFSFKLLHDLQDKGIYIYFCSGTEKAIEDLPKDVVYSIIKDTKHQIYFTVFSNKHIEDSILPVVQVPQEQSLNSINAEILDTEKKLLEINSDLLKLIPQKTILSKYLMTIEEQIEFTCNRDGMLHVGVLASINGYCPVPQIENLQVAAKEHGWGIRLTDPTDSDNPPTLITTPKIIEFSKALFDFIGISPGYKEWDTSACFLFFFTLFFSMIMGDAGYGVIFLVCAIIAKKKFAQKKQFRFYINLFMLLSVSTIFWGFITGNYFAIPAKYLPSWMQGIDWFTDTKLKNQHIQLLCFLIAAIHLSFARFWKASLVINSTKALGEIGWGLILWGNFWVARKLIVYPNSEWPMAIISILYGLGLFFVVLFGVNWKKMDEAFGFLFGMSGTFVDLLSYIRLFAVGLSSYYIAKSFNDMGMMVFNLSSNAFAIPFLIIGMVIVILCGHVLNVMLGFLGVLVHGIRLNTLEFSNHMGLQWLGHLYKPFKKNDD